MRKFLIILFLFLLATNCSYSANQNPFLKSDFFNSDIRGIKSTLNAQVKYANKSNIKKLAKIYDSTYQNADGYDLNTYLVLVKDLWKSYNNIKYSTEIKNIIFNNDVAVAEVVENSSAEVPVAKEISGKLNSQVNTSYYLKKINGKWKIVSENIVSEDTSLLYGLAANAKIKLSAPAEVEPNSEYTATLELDVPKDVFAIGSISKEKIEYPLKQAKEVYRKIPDDNILERLFIANDDKCNEYIVASIGMTKAEVDCLNIKLSLVGFGYKIIRVNVKGAGVDVDKLLNLKTGGDGNDKNR